MLAIVIVTIGLYGIIAYLTVSRRHEIGIRLSLGSTRTQIVMLVLRDSLLLLAAGLLVGLPLAATTMRGASTLPVRSLPDRCDDDGGRRKYAGDGGRTGRRDSGLAGGTRQSRQRSALRLRCPPPVPRPRQVGLPRPCRAVSHLGHGTLHATYPTASCQMRHGSEYARPPFYLGDANWGAVLPPA